MSHWTVPGYTELGELGSGGFGRVVLARHDDSGTIVAIKYLNTERLGGEAFLTPFRDEARTLATLDSPYVTRLYEYVEDGDHAAIVMEAVDGASLRAVLDAHGPAGPEAALSVLTGFAARTRRGSCRLGRAPRLQARERPGRAGRPEQGRRLRDRRVVGEIRSAAGTPAYMAPEQWEGGPAGPATDVYAATCVFFECVTGHRPYDGDQAALRRQHVTAPVPLDDLPEPVRPLVMRGMAKDPADRPPGALEFVAELEAAAREAYGPDWERNGRRRLAEAVAGWPRCFLSPSFSARHRAASAPAVEERVRGRGAVQARQVREPVPVRAEPRVPEAPAGRAEPPVVQWAGPCSARPVPRSASVPLGRSSWASPAPPPCCIRARTVRSVPRRWPPGRRSPSPTPPWSGPTHTRR